MLNVPLIGDTLTVYIGMLPDLMKSFLEQNLPKKKKGVLLGVQEDKLAIWCTLRTGAAFNEVDHADPLQSQW